MIVGGDRDFDGSSGIRVSSILLRTVDYVDRFSSSGSDHMLFQRDFSLMRIIRKKKPLVDIDDDNPGQVMTYVVDDLRPSPSKTLLADFTITSNGDAPLKKVENGGCPVKTRPPPTPPWQGEGSHPKSQPFQRLTSLSPIPSFPLPISHTVLNYPYMDSKDILYIVLAFCALWFTAFLCFALYHIARFMKRMQELSLHAREKFDDLMQSVNSIRMRIESHVSAITNIGDGIRKIMDVLRSRDN